MTDHQDPESVLAYSHIPKAAGTTIIYLLRRNFGVRHFDALDRTPGRVKFYTARDLNRDLKLHPWARSVASHHLMPFVDYGKHDHRLRWYAFFREPRKRLLSQYQYQVETLGVSQDFPDWIRSLPRRNYQVFWLTGGQDLEAAKQVARQKLVAFGLVEHLNESLLILREALGIPDFDVRYDRPKNISRSGDFRERLAEQARQHSDLVEHYIGLETQLYDYLLGELWPRQVEQYGASRLAEDVQTAFTSPPAALGRGRRRANVLYRNLVYKPLVGLGKCLGTASQPWPEHDTGLESECDAAGGDESSPDATDATEPPTSPPGEPGAEPPPKPGG